MWFAFKFYLWQRSYKRKQEYLRCNRVVICFQILSLTTFLQELLVATHTVGCCDLLSNFIFDNVLTRSLFVFYRNAPLWFAFKFYLWQRSYKITLPTSPIWPLWFAFKFYLWQRSYKFQRFSKPLTLVVICFQILSLTTFLQAFPLKMLCLNNLCFV